jgi:DNA-binding response OmpR family regulator
MKILVAEDHLLLGKSIKRALTENDWTVDLAVDGAMDGIGTYA